MATITHVINAGSIVVVWVDTLSGSQPIYFDPRMFHDMLASEGIDYANDLLGREVTVHGDLPWTQIELHEEN